MYVGMYVAIANYMQFITSCHSIRRYVGRYRDRTMQFIDCNLSANDHRTTPKLFIDWCCERGDPPPRRCAAAARCVRAAADIP